MNILSYSALIFTALAGLTDVNAGQTNYLEEIVVAGSKTERPLWRVAAQVETFDRSEMDALQLTDFSAISRYVPALETDFGGSRFGATGLSIRGVGGNRVAFEFDNVPLPQQIAIGSFADSGRLSLDPAVIERVEVMRGPASALYGSDAIAGVVLISSLDGRDLTDDDKPYYLGASSGYFSANNSTQINLTAAWSDEHDSILATVNQRQGHEFNNQSQGVATDRINFEQWQLFTKWSRDLGPAGELRASLDYFNKAQNSDIRAQLGYQRFNTTSRLQGDDSQSRKRIILEYRLPALDYLHFSSLNFYWQDNRTQQLTSQNRTSAAVPVLLQRNFLFREQNWGSEFRLRHDFKNAGLSHILVAGFEWDRQQLHEQRDGLQTELINNISSKNILGEQFPLRDLPRSTTDKIGLFLQDEISVGAFSLIPALRWDHFNLNASTDAIFTDETRLSDLSNEDLTFRLGATWQITERFAVYAHYAEGFRSPPAEDVNLLLDITLFNYRAIPNPELKAERSRSLEAGIRAQWPGGNVTAAGYHSVYKNFIESRALIARDNSSGTLLFQSRNLDRATIYGFEASFSQSLEYFHRRLFAWHVDAGIHWAHGNNEISGAALNSVSPLKALVGIRWQAPTLPLGAELHLTHYGRQARTDFSNGEFFVPGATNVLDLIMNWQQSRHIKWFLGLYNLGNNRYWRYADTRRLELNDPRVEILSQPGFNAALTLHLNY